MSKAVRRSRRFNLTRNMYFETHEKDSNNEAVRVSEITAREWKDKVLKETFEFMPAELGQLDSIAMIFHDRDIENDGNLKVLHCHMIVEFKNPQEITALSNLKFGHGMSLNGQENVFQKNNVQVSKSRSASYRYLTHTTDEAMSQMKVRYEVRELHVKTFDSEGRERKNIASEFIIGDELELWYRSKIKGNVKPEKLAFDELMQECKFGIRTGKFADELEVEEYLTEKLSLVNGTYNGEKQATELVIKHRYELAEARRMYQKSVFNKMSSRGRNLKTIYISGASGVGKSRFAKDLGRAINLGNEKSPNFIYTAATAKSSQSYDFIDSDYKAEDVTIFDDVDSTSFGFQEFLNIFDKDNITKISSRYTNKSWVSHYAIITKSSHLGDWVDRLARTSTEYFKERFNQIVQISRRFELWIDIDLSKGLVRFMRFNHNVEESSSSCWKCVFEFKISKKDFHSDSSERQRLIQKAVEFIHNDVQEFVEDEEAINFDFEEEIEIDLFDDSDDDYFTFSDSDYTMSDEDISEFIEKELAEDGFKI